MNFFKEAMMEAVEAGRCCSDHAYDFVRETMADAADRKRKEEKENSDSQKFEKEVPQGCTNGLRSCHSRSQS